MKLKKVLDDRRINTVYAVCRTKALREAARKMIAFNCSALMVTDCEDTPVKYVGIISHSDLVRAMSMESIDLGTVPVSDFMTRQMIVASEEDDVEYVMNVMVRHTIGHLPVIVGKQIGGIISKNDILQVLNVDREITIQWMNDFSGVSAKNSVY